MRTSLQLKPRLFIWSLMVLQLMMGASAHAAPTVQCSVTQLQPPFQIAPLGGLFEYQAKAFGDGKQVFSSKLLVLTQDGEIIQEIAVQPGDTFLIAIREQVIIEHHDNGPFDWLIHAPGVLFRATVTEGFLSDIAYCGPFAAIRVDQPTDTTFVSTTNAPSAPVRLTVGTARMAPESIKIFVDCVDIVQAVGATIPGGPFSGSAQIAGTTVEVADFTSNLNKGRIDFTLNDLPGGTHLVRVEGQPDYLSQLPPGYVNWIRPLGQLEHEREIYVFRVDIESPSDGTNIPFGQTTVTGKITHGLPIKSLRIHGSDVPLPPAVVIPGDGCIGDALVVNFSFNLAQANIAQDFATGNDALASLDPGVNYISAIAADFGGHAPNDRVRVNVGDVIQVGASRPMPIAGADCSPADELPGFVTNGFAVSLSEKALDQSIRNKVLDGIRNDLSEALTNLEGQTVDELIDPCSGPAPIPPTITHRGVDTPYDVLASQFGRHANEIVRATGNVSKTTGSKGKGGHKLQGNRPPTFDPIANQTVNIAAVLDVPLVASDPDGDDVEFQLITGPTNSQINNDHFTFVPECSQVGKHSVTIRATDGSANTDQSFQITVTNTVQSIPVPATITDVIFDTNTMNIVTTLPGTDQVRLTFDSGPITIKMSAGDCYGDCLIDCCVSWDLDFDIVIQNVRATIDLTAQQLLCGISDPSELGDPEVTLEGLNVDFGDPHIRGVVGWLTGITLINEILNIFGVGQSLLDSFLADPVVDAIEDPLHDALVNQFPGVQFSGLHELEFDPTFPASVPMTLDTESADIPVILPNSAFSMGVFSAFTPTVTPDPTPPFYPTLSGVPNARGLNGDVMIAVSDDALNQMFAALTATGSFRQQFSGLTVGDVSPGLSIPPLNIFPETPVLLTIDSAQDSGGNGVPPIIGFIDDTNTAPIELKIRVQMAVRGIIERGGTVTDDRNLCSCTDLTPTCIGSPCLFYESVLKMNLLLDLNLTTGPGPSATMQLVVTDVQELDRPPGFDSFEAKDFTDDQDDIVNTSATSPLLAMIQTELNNRMAPFDVPPLALSLAGFVNPTNVRLFSATVDSAGLGFQDYIGLLSDVED
jgi:hypothetical protein